MKKLYTLLIATIMLTGSINAQIHLFLQEQEIDLKDGKSSAWVLPVARDLDEALDDLKDYCKDRSDVRLKKRRRESVDCGRSIHTQHCHQKGRPVGLRIHNGELLWPGPGISTGL